MKIFSKRQLTLLISFGFILNGCAPSNIQINQEPGSNVFISPKMRDANLIPASQNLKKFPNKIAILLPLSGDYQRQGESVLNGFLGAHYSLSPENQEVENISVYDTQKYEDVKDAYDEAVTDGAKFIVGPLLQKSVNQLTQKIAFNVPVLALNSTEANNRIIGLYQFSLSSIDEVISTSNKVISDNNKIGIIIVPDNTLGLQLKEIYKTTFESMGGMIIDDQFYDPEKQDYTEELKDILIIENSEKRHRRLSANLNEFLAFNPRRRQDIDFIFLLATDTTNAKLLKSQLKYHLSGDEPIPVYSTSNIYSFNDDLSDLNGITFTDAPWVIDQQSWLENLPSIIRKYWPGNTTQSRQNAMGYDAYFLISELSDIRNYSMNEFNGATGQLFMDYDLKIRRRLAWAKLVNGNLEIEDKNIQE